MAETGIDVAAATPEVLDPEVVRRADVVVTMGCGDTCPVYPGRRYEDRELEDPAGKDLDTVRRIRDDADQRIDRRDQEYTALGQWQVASEDRLDHQRADAGP